MTVNTNRHTKMKMTSKRVDYLYDVMDAAYDAAQMY